VEFGEGWGGPKLLSRKATRQQGASTSPQLTGLPDISTAFLQKGKCIRRLEEGLRTRTAERGVDLIAWTALDLSTVKLREPAEASETQALLPADDPGSAHGEDALNMRTFLLGTELTLTGKALDSEKGGRKFQAQQIQALGQMGACLEEKGSHVCAPRINSV